MPRNDPATDHAEALAARKKRRRRVVYALLFTAWVLSGIYMFQYMWENRHAVDEDGKSILWKSYDRDKEEE